MTLLLLSTLAVAAEGPPSDALVQTVSTIYGKAVPPAAICTAQPELPEEFDGAPVAVAVMRGAAGCRLMGVLVNGAWTETADAARVSLGESWARAKQARRDALLEAWTEGVLLAFDQLDPSVKVAASPGTTGDTRVGGKIWQRTEERHVARHTDAVFTFDKEARLSLSERTAGEDWRTAFYVKDERVEGVTVDTVMGALSQQGKALKMCMDEAWKQDLTVEGRVKLQWTIRDSAATQVAIVEDGETSPARESLAGCYGEALRRIKFPEGAAGTVVWSFSVVRGPHTPQ